ncbi:hypothetical protein BpHYR1_046110 [Brachionus plicatilis]|uniref:Uncharacterized protein n=1 Tax=Brachionus plicatilis TaxID=10195 RepID=A0A3M7QN60_BRAPC|nr:hypothetical protein BpHYR1_046110 [Brachionus plicatilis]
MILLELKNFIFFTNGTHDLAKNPSFKQGLSKGERHANSRHQKIRNCQVNEKYGQLSFGPMAQQID